LKYFTEAYAGLLRLGKNYAEEPIGFVEHGRLQRLDPKAADDRDQQLRLRLC
jgi:hypothetical protein